MQDDHGFIWDAMLQTAALDLAGLTVLDIGCNQGGFLRLAADRFAIRRGCGYDPAAGAVDRAKQLCAERPIEYVVADSLPEGWTGFDVAFSHEVLYLLHDLTGHAAAVRQALRAGASYFAVMGTHDRNPLTARWQRELAKTMDVPPIYSLDEVARVFAEAGFSVAVSRLDIRFVPVTGPAVPDLATMLSYYHQDKYMFRFTAG
jgi:SAM-dependent methyltransferase